MATESGPLSLTFGRSDGTVVVRVRGEIDVTTAPRLRAGLETVIEEQGNLSVQLDLDALSFIDSYGLQVLVQAWEQLRQRGGQLTLSRVPLRAVRLLEITGLATRFGI